MRCAVARDRADVPATGVRARIAGFAAGSALSQLIVALSIPVIARLYDPAVLGNFLIFDAYCDVLAFGATLALDKALYVTRSHRGSRALILATVLSIGLVAALGAGLFWVAVIAGLTTPGLAMAWLAIPCFLIVFARGAFYLLQSLSIRADRFGAVVLAENIRAGVIVFGRIGLGLQGFGLTGLVLTAVAGAGGAVAVLARGQGPMLQRLFARPALRLVPRVLARHRERILFEGGGQFLRQLPMRGPVFAVTIFYLAPGAGIYAIALLLTYRPTELVVRSVTEVFRAAMARNLRAGQEDAAAARGRILLWRLYLAAVASSAAMGLAVYLTEGWLFPPDWAGVGAVALANSLYVAGLLILRPVQMVFSLYGRQRLSFLLEAGAVLACFSGIFLGGGVGLSLAMTCLLTGVAMLAFITPMTALAHRMLGGVLSAQA